MLRQASAKAENEQVRKAAEVLLVDRERKIREYIDGGNLPRNIDEAVAVKVADNGVFSKKMRFCQFVTCEIMYFRVKMRFCHAVRFGKRRF